MGIRLYKNRGREHAYTRKFIHACREGSLYKKYKIEHAYTRKFIQAGTRKFIQAGIVYV